VICSVEDLMVMLNVMLKKCNDVINNTQVFKENDLSTKKIFDD